MFVKMCGMTQEVDVDYACTLGVDAVGFIFAASPRNVSIEQAKLLSQRASSLLKVGVFVDESIEVINHVRRECKLDVVQLHGNESPEFCEQLGGEIFKAFRLKNNDVMSKFELYPSKVKLLVDSWANHAVGGTGRQIDGKLLDQINDFSRIIIAGGLGPENSAEIIEHYSPYGVDINSKIEIEPGVKDHEKMKRVMDLFKKMNQENN